MAGIGRAEPEIQQTTTRWISARFESSTVGRAVSLVSTDVEQISDQSRLIRTNTCPVADYYVANMP